MVCDRGSSREYRRSGGAREYVYCTYWRLTILWFLGAQILQDVLIQKSGTRSHHLSTGWSAARASLSRRCSSSVLKCLDTTLRLWEIVEYVTWRFHSQVVEVHGFIRGRSEVSQASLLVETMTLYCRVKVLVRATYTWLFQRVEFTVYSKLPILISFDLVSVCLGVLREIYLLFWKETSTENTVLHTYNIFNTTPSISRSERLYLIGRLPRKVAIIG